MYNCVVLFFTFFLFFFSVLFSQLFFSAFFLEQLLSVGVTSSAVTKISASPAGVKNTDIKVQYSMFFLLAPPPPPSVETPAMT